MRNNASHVLQHAAEISDVYMYEYTYEYMCLIHTSTNVYMYEYTYEYICMYISILLSHIVMTDTSTSFVKTYWENPKKDWKNGKNLKLSHLGEE